MTRKNETEISETEIKRYLFGEMSEDELDKIEAEFFENDELFVEIGETENRLVDLYARGKLAGDDLIRFERSLEKYPERRAKIANAAALKTFIGEGKPSGELSKKIVPAPIEQTFWSKLTEFFSVKSPAFNVAAMALLLVFAISTVFLLIDNQRKAGELAALQNNQQGDWQQRQQELQTELAIVSERVGELQKQTENQTKTGDGLVGDLETVREEKQRIEGELKQLRKERNIVPTPKPQQTNAPTLASFLLTPILSSKSGNNTPARVLAVKNEIKRISMQLVLAEETKADEKFSVKLNDETIAGNQPISVSSSGQKSLNVSFPADKTATGANKIAVVNSDGAEVTKYIFNVDKKQ